MRIQIFTVHNYTDISHLAAKHIEKNRPYHACDSSSLTDSNNDVLRQHFILHRVDLEHFQQNVQHPLKLCTLCEEVVEDHNLKQHLNAAKDMQ